MALIVQKYGGTSVGSVERIEAVAERFARHHSDGDQLIIVVSAMSGETNRLLGLARELTSNPSPRELDVLVSTGEQVSMSLLAMALHKRGIEALSLKGSQVAIRTDSFHSKARIQSIDDRRLRAELNQGRVVVVAGFQGVDENGEVTTLGGADLIPQRLLWPLLWVQTNVRSTPTLMAFIRPIRASLTVHSDWRPSLLKRCWKWPAWVQRYCSSGSVEFAGKYQVPLRVLSSFKEGPGTLIKMDEDDPMEAPTIAGIAFNRDEAKLTVIGVPDTPGIAYQILGPIGDANIEVDVILQNVGDEGKTDFTFTVSRRLRKAEAILESHIAELGALEWRSDSRIAKVSVVGVGMRSHAGVAANMFRALAEVGVNMQMISTSEIKISVIIEEKFWSWLHVRCIQRSGSINLRLEKRRTEV